MSVRAPSIQSLIDEIAITFGEEASLSDGDLLHPECCDDVDIVDFYGKKQWQDITDDVIVNGYAAPSFFSAAAFRYFTPAFMCWTLRNPDNPAMASESFLISLDPGTDEEMLHEFRVSKFDNFSERESKLLTKCLLCLSEHANLGEFADAALLNYWIRFVDD